MLSIPAPEQTLQDLSPLIPILYASIEGAIVKTRSFFEGEGKKHVDLSLAPNLVRYFAKDLLQRGGQDVDDDIDMENLANNGLQIRAEAYAIRVLKSDNGSPPAPGASKAKQNFYHQYTFYFVPPDGSMEGGATNLILLWDVDSEYRLRRLLLACPMGGDTKKSSVECHWIATVPHPALSVAAARSNAGVATVSADLPLAFRNAGEAEAETND